MTKLLLTPFILIPLFSFGQKLTKADTLIDRKIIKRALTNRTERQILVDKVLPDSETAISVAEPILFKIYGKKQITGEKPYNVNLIDGYWVLSGSLPSPKSDEEVEGGTFLIILSSKDGRVIKLEHGK